VKNPFIYVLPEDRIAQRHAGFDGRREDSKLLSLSWKDDSFDLSDHSFKDILSVLRPGDLLVLNNTRVLHARFFLNLSDGKDAEVLLIRPDQISETAESSIWEVLARPMRKFKEGSVLNLSEHIKAEVLGRTTDERFLKLKLSVISDDNETKSLIDWIEKEGNAPIPPYIRGGRSDFSDKEVYQTVFAGTDKGSVAAPTASLHFSNEILDQLLSNDIALEYLTLHVGPGSFLPIDENVENLDRVYEERFYVPQKTWDAVIRQKNDGQRVIGVGTTVVRALESIARKESPLDYLNSWQETDLFLKPGSSFHVIDAMFTNFHQPRSTHLQLVAAFIGVNAISSLYQHALNSGYAFLSYGDSCFLEKSKTESSKN